MCVCVCVFEREREIERESVCVVIQPLLPCREEVKLERMAGGWLISGNKSTYECVLEHTYIHIMHEIL